MRRVEEREREERQGEERKGEKRREKSERAWELLEEPPTQQFSPHHITLP